MIIGISGKMGAGKDFLYNEIWTRRTEATRLAFADVLRREIEEYLAGGDHIPALWNKPYSEPVRRLLQWWGTEFRRAQNPNYWVEKGEGEALKLEASGYLVVITDVRFENEAEMVRRNNGYLVRVEAPYEVRKERLGMEPPNHDSETGLDEWTDWNWVLDSSGTSRYDYSDSVYELLEQADPYRR